MLRKSITLIALIALSLGVSATPQKEPNSDYLSLEIEKFELEQELFGETVNNEVVDITSIELYELEETVVLNFDTQTYLPENFDARQGMHDLDWNTIPLIEVEEEVELGFNTKDYLPENFNAQKGMLCTTKNTIVTASF